MIMTYVKGVPTQTIEEPHVPQIPKQRQGKTNTAITTL